MNDRITLCFDRQFAEELNSALHEVLSFDDDCIVFDDSIRDVLDDLHLILDIHLNCRLI